MIAEWMFYATITAFLFGIRARSAAWWPVSGRPSHRDTLRRRVTLSSRLTPDQIVLSVAPGPALALNTISVPADRLAELLAQVYDPRPRKSLFIEAEENVAYGDVIRAIDAAPRAGVAVIGPVLRRSVAGLKAGLVVRNGWIRRSLLKYDESM